jgi:serine/threonine protein kinase/Tol biopolymer transport system component
MDEAPRRRIGPYEIASPPHVGGMGEVYRAWDPRLKREVAIKVLHSAAAEDPIRRQRLLEEAQAAGSLNHPNILAVYDVGEHEGKLFIVTEYIRGKELRAEIERGAIPTKRLLDLAAQIADGLRAAHEAGIVHRDLKPGNVMITPDGRVKIVDFGLAKAFAPDTGAHDAVTVTLPGTIVGTAPYMSPEQARGSDVDFKTDQFSFGLMLYEMATGTNPFRRDSSAQTMAAIIADEFRPISELNARTPMPLRWIIERCLAKEPIDRYASTTDLYRDLAMLQGRLGELTSDDNRPVEPPAKSYRIRAVAAALALILVVGTVALLAVAPAPSAPPRYSPLVTDRTFQGTPAFSKDGKALAYVSSVDGILQVFTRNLETAAPLQVTRSQFDCSDPFWSPDNARIYYHAQALDAQGLWSISAAGGPPELVLENATRATISSDVLAFFREGAENKGEFGLRRSIWVASANGANARRYMEAPFDTRTFVDGMLRFSPDGSKILAWVWGWADEKTGVPSAEFWILPWPTGKPRRVLPSLGRAAPAAASFDWLPDSRRIVVSLWDDATTGMHLWTADTENDTSTPVTATPGSENWPDVTPDGQRVAFASESIDFDLVEIPLDGGLPRNLMATSRNELDPSFTRDGSQFAYVSDKGGALRIWLRSSRDEQFERAVVGPEQFPPGEPTLALGALSISPDGERIAYQRYTEESGYQIWVSTVAAAGPPVLLASGLFYQDGPTWSPDGSSVAFLVRTKQLTTALAVVRVGTRGEVETILPDVATLGLRPQWSPDGRWIICDTLDGVVVVSRDGKQRKEVSQEFWIASAWAPDSRTIYVLREADRLRHYALSAVNVDTLVERVINPDLGPIPHASQPIRGLTLSSPTTIVTSVASVRSDIWVLDGYARPRTVLQRLVPWISR